MYTRYFFLVLALLCLVGSTLFSSIATAHILSTQQQHQHHTKQQLTSVGAAQLSMSVVQRNSVLRSRLIRLKPQQFDRQAHTATIPLFRRKALHVQQQQFFNYGAGRSVWIGTVPDNPSSEVIIAVHDTVLAGTIRLNGGIYHIRHVQRGRYVLQEMNPHVLPPDQDIINAESMHTSIPPSAEKTSTAEEDGSIIDVMVVYTPKARDAAGGTDAIGALIDLAIVNANQVNDNSAIPFDFWLTHTDEVDYDEDVANTTVDILNDLQEGRVDDVHDQRDHYRADVVSMVVERDDLAGQAQTMTTMDPAFESEAYSIIDTDYIGDARNTLAHEIGHNMGSAHDRAHADMAPSHPYSYGYQDPGCLFSTVMSYQTSPDGTVCPRIPYWSNPDVSYQGVPTGIDYEENPSTAADNARSLTENAKLVSNFRNATCTPPTSGSWIIDGPCKLYQSATVAGSVDVYSHTILTIMDQRTLNINFKNYHLRIVDGGGVWLRDKSMID